jgi:hypothetical protein
MKRSFLICALILSACVSRPARADTSPVGTWQVSTLGSQQGILMMTFSNDNSVAGYGITRKQFGFITLAGTWGIDSKGDVEAAYVQTVDGAGTAYRLIAHMLPSGRFRGRATSKSGGYTCKGEQPESLPSLTGLWNAGLKRKGQPLAEVFTATPSSNYPAIYDITGSGFSETGSFTLSGEIIVSSENKVNASIARTFGIDTQHSILSGVFKSKHSGDQMRLQGSDDTHAHLSEIATR